MILLLLNLYTDFKSRAKETTTAAPAMAGAISGKPKAMHCQQVA